MLQKCIFQQRGRGISLLFIGLIMTGCSQVGPYVEPVEPDALPAGPGLFTGNAGGLTFESKRKDIETNGSSDAKMKAKDLTEFEQFKEWQKLKSNTSLSSETKQYEEFLQWLEFKKFKGEQSLTH